MTNNIGNIGGYGYSIGGYYGNPGSKGTTTNNDGNTPLAEGPQPERVDVDPNKVLEFLAASSVNMPKTPAVTPGSDAATAERVDGYIQNFEMIFNVIAQEFGQKAAEQLMNDDDFIDRLMALA